LRQYGFAVTVFDGRQMPGGLNTYGIAEYKFRPRDSLKEVELVRSLGVEFHLGEEVGVTIPVEKMEQEFDAIFIGVGLGPTQPLSIPGEDLEGVTDALSFIARYKTGQAWIGRRVLVIGAGNTAIDAATAAKRLGAERVAILYRRGEKEMPAFRYEFKLAKQDGIEFQWFTQPYAIHGSGSVECVECLRMELGPPDRTGRRSPRIVDGSNFVIPCDMVITSIGQSRLIDFLARFRNITLAAGCVVVDPDTGRTANPKYFAGGDCVNGGREVVDAVAEGKRAGRGIARCLGGNGNG
jgi:glutamate synthase (NADPH/NADH) small chain